MSSSEGRRLAQPLGTSVLDEPRSGRGPRTECSSHTHGRGRTPKQNNCSVSLLSFPESQHCLRDTYKISGSSATRLGPVLCSASRLRQTHHQDQFGPRVSCSLASCNPIALDFFPALGASWHCFGVVSCAQGSTQAEEGAKVRDAWVLLTHESVPHQPHTARGHWSLREVPALVSPVAKESCFF